MYLVAATDVKFSIVLLVCFTSVEDLHNSYRSLGRRHCRDTSLLKENNEPGNIVIVQLR